MIAPTTARTGTRRATSSTGRPATTRPGTGSSAYRRFEAEGARPGEDRRGEDRVQHRVAVLGADVAAEQRLQDADEQPGDQRPAGLAEPAVGGGEKAGERDRRARQVGEPGDRRLHDAEHGGDDRGPDEDQPPVLAGVDADDARADRVLAARLQ